MAEDLSRFTFCFLLLVKTKEGGFHPKGEDHHHKGDQRINVSIDPVVALAEGRSVQRGKEKVEEAPQYAAQSVNGGLPGQFF